jgi:hypothetical protein
LEEIPELIERFRIDGDDVLSQHVGDLLPVVEEFLRTDCAGFE